MPEPRLRLVCELCWVSPVLLFVCTSRSVPTSTVGPGTGTPMSRAVLSRHKVVTQPRLAMSSEDRLQARSLEQDPCPQSLIRGQRGRRQIKRRALSTYLRAGTVPGIAQVALRDLSTKCKRSVATPTLQASLRLRGQGTARLHVSEPGINLLRLLGSRFCLSCSRRDRGWVGPTQLSGQPELPEASGDGTEGKLGAVILWKGAGRVFARSEFLWSERQSEGRGSQSKSCWGRCLELGRSQPLGSGRT